jgi:hypothetical protein
MSFDPKWLEVLKGDDRLAEATRRCCCTNQEQNNAATGNFSGQF